MFGEDRWIELMVWATARLACVAMIAGVALRWAVVTSPQTHRWVWSAVLLQSLLLVPWVLQIPVMKSAVWTEPTWTPQVSSLAGAQLPNPTQPLVAGESPTVNAGQLWDWLAMLWLTGCLGMLACLVLSQMVIGRLMGTAVPARDAWQSQMDDVLRRFELKKSVPLLVHPSAGPLLARSLCGFRVLVPRDVWAGLSAQQREAVLMHELAHLQRGDVWKSLIMRSVAAVHWFNPCAWWAVTKFDEAAEWDCDRRVRAHSESMAADLAGALLQVSQPSSLIRLGVSSARGRRVGDRIRRLVGEPMEESQMKKFFAVAVTLLVLAIGTVQIRLVAQEMRVRNSVDLGDFDRDIERLGQALAESTNNTDRKLADALLSDAGRLVLRDRLAKRVSSEQQLANANIIDSVLEEHFVVEGDAARLLDATDPVRQQLVSAGDTSLRDVQELTASCAKIAARLEGDDEVTQLVKRFLQSDTGPSFLYVSVLRDRMRPGMAMLSGALGKILALDTDGLYYVRPDAQEQIKTILDQSQVAEQVCTAISQELKVWSEELTADDELHRRIQQAAEDPIFAALIVAERLFEKQNIPPGMALKVLEQLDSVAVDTAAGLKIHDQARPEISDVLRSYETVRERIEPVRSALQNVRSKISEAGAVEQEFKRFLGTDLALAGLARETELADASSEQLILSVLGEAFEGGASEQLDGPLRLVRDQTTRTKVQEQVQKAFREMRSARRRSAPVRQLAKRIEDPGLARGLASVGGLLVIKQLAEQKLAAIQRAVFVEWQQETFIEKDGKIQLRDAVQNEVNEFLAQVEETKRELSGADF